MDINTSLHLALPNKSKVLLDDPPFVYSTPLYAKQIWVSSTAGLKFLMQPAPLYLNQSAVGTVVASQFHQISGVQEGSCKPTQIGGARIQPVFTGDLPMLAQNFN